MSILGVKKKHVDTSEIEKEILKIKSELLTMNTKDKYLYNSINTLNLGVLNMESMITSMKNKPDRKIISIYAGLDNTIEKGNIWFTFNNDNVHYVMSYPGQILSISLVCSRINRNDEGVVVTINDKELKGSGISLGSTINWGNYNRYINFDTPFKVEAGDAIGFIRKTKYNTCSHTLVSLIIELFL